MKGRMSLAALLLTLLIMVVPVYAQGETADPVSAQPGDGVRIIWPTPVTEVWGVGDVIGTASVANFQYYFLEYLPLNEDLSLPSSAPWLPATVASSSPAINAPLATLDTTLVEDGLYALRLTVTTSDGSAFYDIVSPIRVANERFNRVTDRIVNATISQLIEDGMLPAPPTETPVPPTAEPTAAPPQEDLTPRVVSATPGTSSNIRQCDLVDNDRCPIIAWLNPGEVGLVIGVSTRGGWYQVQLPSGVIGWVSQTVVLTGGDFSTVPFVTPPDPLPPPPPPGNTVPNFVVIQGGSATCNVPFNVEINLVNLGGQNAAGGTVSVQDVNLRTGEITGSSSASFPSLSPGGNYTVIVPMTITAYYNEGHELRARAGGQEARLAYTLGQGNCNAVPPTPTPGPGPETQDRDGDGIFDQYDNCPDAAGTSENYGCPVQPGDIGRPLAGGECHVAIVPGAPYYREYNGPQLGNLGGNTLSEDAIYVQISGGRRWYRMFVLGAGPVWFPNDQVIQSSGNCNPMGR